MNGPPINVMSRTILIVDDYSESLLLLQELLALQGYFVYGALLPEEAIQSMRTHWHSLVLIDDDPYGHSGIQLALQLKELARDSNRAAPYLVALRGDLFRETEPSLLGFNVALSKPLDFDQLDDVVREALIDTN